MELLFSLLVFLTSCLLFHDCRKLDGYKFPVYTTKSCPENEIEWNRKSSAFNCSKESSYACFPNNEITELIEFCYPLRDVIIPEGTCLFLSKTRSELETYDCSKTFRCDCPEKQYLSSSIYLYPYCLSISDGCFNADPICNRTKKNTEKNMYLYKYQTNWALFAVCYAPLIVFVLVTVPGSILYNRKKRRDKKEAIRRLLLEEEENLKALQHLLAEGADLNQCDNTGVNRLHKPCQKGHDRTVQLLLENGAEVNLCKRSGASPLYTACKNGHDSTVQILLNKGAEVNLYKETGASPLHIACQNGHKRTVQLLLNNGAEVNLCKRSGASPLYIACKNGHDSTVQILLNKGADVNLCKRSGASPLHKACQNGHNSIVQILLNNGANVNLCDNTGVSPLYLACLFGHDSSVHILLRNGADRNLWTEKGYSPLCIASQNCHKSILKADLTGQCSK